MAKKSKIVKAAKQRELIKKYYELKEAGDVEALAKLPVVKKLSIGCDIQSYHSEKIGTSCKQDIQTINIYTKKENFTNLAIPILPHTKEATTLVIIVKTSPDRP